MKLIGGCPDSLTDKPFHYCPGCGHGIIHRLIAEVIDEMGIAEETIGVGPVGCSVVVYDYFNIDFLSSAHGRAPAVATGVKRAHPDKIVFTYQGDGDLASIGTAEIVHAANRGELITTIFVNNAIYGMTGGQMAPTSLIGQKTSTSPYGRDAKKAGYPIKISEMLTELDGAVYITRVSVGSPGNIDKAKKAIKKAIKIQQEGKGFSMIEVLSFCPTSWNMKPVDAKDWLNDVLTSTYPLGDLKISKEVD